MPTLYVIAGPNGAGKTTFAEEFLPNYTDCTEFVNADLIAAGLSPFSPKSVEREADELFLRRIRKLAEERQDFAIETTLSGRGMARWLREIRSLGYKVHIIYLWIDTPDVSLGRVAQRVADGGHDVPREAVRRRHKRSATSSRCTTRLRTKWPYTIIEAQSPDWSSSEERAKSRFSTPPCSPRSAVRRRGLMMNKKDILNLPVHIRAEMALKAAVAKVVKQRRQQGRPLIVSRNGKAVELDPAQAELVAEEPGSYEVGPQKPDP